MTPRFARRATLPPASMPVRLRHREFRTNPRHAIGLRGPGVRGLAWDEGGQAKAPLEEVGRSASRAARDRDDRCRHGLRSRDWLPRTQVKCNEQRAFRHDLGQRGPLATSALRCRQPVPAIRHRRGPCAKDGGRSAGRVRRPIRSCSATRPAPARACTREGRLRVVRDRRDPRPDPGHREVEFPHRAGHPCPTRRAASTARQPRPAYPASPARRPAACLCPSRR